MILETEIVEMLIYFWKVGADCAGCAGSACLSLSCPLGAYCAGSLASGPAGRLALVLWSCVPSFCPISRFVFGALPANVALFRVLRAFLESFGAFVWVCLAFLACVLCVACGAFVCVSG